MKEKRQSKILELIQKKKVNRQEELLALLKQEGFNATQATVSRDIRELNLVKAAGEDGGYYYIAAFANDRQKNKKSRFETFFKEAALKVDHAGNIVLVKCFTGMANAACELFDAMVWDDVVGTLSGDDTFIVLMRSEKAAKLLRDIIGQYLGNKA